jgi:hypothetical protein
LSYLNSILEELGKELRGTPFGELPHLKSYRLEGGPFIYIYHDQQSGQWLIRATDNQGLPTPSDDQRGAVEGKEKIPLNVKSTSADQVTPSKGTQSDKRDRVEEEGMETDPSPSGQNTHTRYKIRSD